MRFGQRCSNSSRVSRTPECTYSRPRFPEPSTEMGAVVPASAPSSTCRRLVAAARPAARPVRPLPDKSSARESTRPHVSTGRIDGGHVLLHEPRAQLAEITAEAIAKRLALRLTVIREHHDVV